MKMSTAALLATAAMGVLASLPARADDYTDLLDILHARGSLSTSEYQSLRAKHLHGARAGRHARTTTTTETVETSDAEAQSRRDALAAAASAAAVT